MRFHLVWFQATGMHLGAKYSQFRQANIRAYLKNYILSTTTI